MASSPSAKKRIRQNLKHRARNRWRKRTLKDVLKELEDKLVHADVAEVQSAFRAACKVLDRTAQKGVIHSNTAARKKSRLSARVKERQTSGVAGAPAAKAKSAKAAKPAAAAKGAAPKAAPKAAKPAGAAKAPAKR